MQHVNKLKIKSLLKKYDYYLSEIEWIESHILNSEKDFMQCVDSIVNTNVELKEMYDRTLSINYIEESNIINEEDIFTENNTIEKSSMIKKLFRLIVKETHPDRVNDVNLVSIYNKAVESYDDDNLLEIYRICDDLNIEHNINLEDLYIENEIEKLDKRLEFLKNSYIHKWLYCDSTKNKNEIILEYIKNQL